MRELDQVDHRLVSRRIKVDRSQEMLLLNTRNPVVNLVVIRGHRYGEEIDKVIEAGFLTITEVTSVEQMFTMLARGRIDLALANATVGFASAKEYAQGSEISEGRVVFEAVFTTVSLITTSAYVHDTSVAAGAPLALIVSVIIVGGAYGSTAGGLKIGRVERMVEDGLDRARHLDSVIECEVFHRGEGHLATSAPSAIRAGDDHRHVVAGCDEGPQRGHR